MSTTEPEPLHTPTLGEAISAAIEGLRGEVHTCQVGTVISYDAVTQTASIQLTQRRSFVDEDGTTQTESPAPLLGVPVLFPGSGAYSITFPVNAGDSVLVVFSENALDVWHRSGQSDVDPGDDRRHSLSDAIAIPGLRSRNGAVAGPPPSDALVVTAPKVLLGSKDAAKTAANNDDLRQVVSIIIGAVGSAAGAALSSYVGTHPTFPAGSPKVKLE